MLPYCLTQLTKCNRTYEKGRSEQSLLFNILSTKGVLNVHAANLTNHDLYPHPGYDEIYAYRPECVSRILEGSMSAMTGVALVFLIFWSMTGATFFDVLNSALNQISVEDMNLGSYYMIG